MLLSYSLNARYYASFDENHTIEKDEIIYVYAFCKKDRLRIYVYESCYTRMYTYNTCTINFLVYVLFVVFIYKIPRFDYNITYFIRDFHYARTNTVVEIIVSFISELPFLFLDYVDYFFSPDFNISV